MNRKSFPLGALWRASRFAKTRFSICFARKNENLEIVDTLLIEKQSAKIPGRPVFNEMINRIEKGEASGILSWHPDRLARNSVDGGKIIYLVDTGKIADLKFPTFWFDPTPQGKFMLSIAFGQSKYYVDNLSENIKRGIRQKLRNGIWPTWAPLGYLNDKNQRRIVVDKEKAKYIKRAFEMYSTGEYPLAQIRKIINSLPRRFAPRLPTLIFRNAILGGVYLKISEPISLTGSAGGIPPRPPFRPPHLSASGGEATLSDWTISSFSFRF